MKNLCDDLKRKTPNICPICQFQIQQHVGRQADAGGGGVVGHLLFEKGGFASRRRGGEGLEPVVGEWKNYF